MSDTLPPTLSIAPELLLPLESVTQTFGVLAKRGMGKTYTAAVIVEEMLKAGAQVVVSDPVGVWYGLRSNAAGDGPGLPIAILGGEHADLPLHVDAGERVAELIVTERIPAVLDLSLFRKGEQTRFMTDFCETLYRINRQALHLVLDEADTIAPQRPLPGEQRLLGAVEDLVRRGRARGLGITLITQRPAVLNKNVLTQIEVLIALRLIAPQDRAAIDSWVQVHGTPEQLAELNGSLPSLEVGEAWIWSPGWLNLFQRIHVRRRETFDSSSTPKAGETVQVPRQLAPVDLEALRARLATPAPEETDDPAALRAEIARLQAQLEELRAQPAPEPVRVEVPVFPVELRGRVVAAWEALKEVDSALLRATGEIAALSRQVTGNPAPAETGPSEASSNADPAPEVPPAPVASEPLPERQVKPAAKPAPRTRLQSAEGDILRAVAQFAALGLPAVDRRHAAIFSGQSPTSSAYDRKVKALRDAGFLVYPQPGLLALTDRGRDYTSGVTKPASADALRAAWLKWLDPGEAAVLRPLLGLYPRALSRADLARVSRQSATSSAFDRKIKSLKDLGLVDYPAPGTVAATALLFPDRRR